MPKNPIPENPIPENPNKAETPISESLKTNALASHQEKWKVHQRIHFYCPEGYWVRGMISSVDQTEVFVLNFYNGQLYPTHPTSPTLRPLEQTLPKGVPYYDFEKKQICKRLIMAIWNEQTEIGCSFFTSEEKMPPPVTQHQKDQINDYRWIASPSTQKFCLRDKKWLFLSRKKTEASFQEIGGWIPVYIYGLEMHRIHLITQMSYGWIKFQIPMSQAQECLWPTLPGEGIGLSATIKEETGHVVELNQKQAKINMISTWIDRSKLDFGQSDPDDLSEVFADEKKLTHVHPWHD